MTGDHATPASSVPPNYIDVSAGLIFRNGLLLITQRHPDAHLGGLWEFPGGKRHPDETDEDCLRRELMEELGIEVQVGGLLATIEHQYLEKAVRLKFFRCRWLRNEPKALGCHAFTWVSPEQLSDYAFPAADEQLLKKLVRSPELWS
jgi:mutator protein MutT